MNQPQSVSRGAKWRAFDSAPILAVTLFVLTLIVLVPAHVFLVNKSAVMVVFKEVLCATTLSALVVILALSGILLLMPLRPRRLIAVCLLGVSCLFWIHAYCLVWPYDVLDGGDIPWDSYTGRSMIDMALWILVLGPMLWLAPRIYPRVSSACLALLAIQLASLGISAARSYDSPLDFFKHYYVENAKAFELSAQKNVIVILVDEFQTDVFSEAVLPHPDYRRHFPGFTYFPDTVAGFNFTEFALPAILTGRIYDNGIPRDQFLRQAYLESSVPALLKQEGFSVELYPWPGLTNEAVYFHEDVASNFKRRPLPAAAKWADVFRLLDLGIFRSMPQFAKPSVYNSSKWIFSDLYSRWSAKITSNQPPTAIGGEANPIESESNQNLDNDLLEFAKNKRPLGKGILLSEEAPAFKFYHLAGLHVPVKLKKDLGWGGYEYNRRNYSEQAEAYAMILGAFLDELQRLKAYDNSMIIILGDHGSGRSPELHVTPDDPQRTQVLNQTAVRGDFQRDKARGLPLLLVKRFNEQGDIKVSKAPASLVDVPATIMAELGLDYPNVDALVGQKGFHGLSLYQIPEHQSRERFYGAMKWTAEGTDFVDSIILYRIQGPGWSDKSWFFVEKLEPRKP